VTVFEALKAFDRLQQEGLSIRVIDLYSVQPIDTGALRASAAETGGVIVTVEDHFSGGGIGDAVAAATSGTATVHKLAVTEIARSGTPDELIDRYGLSARHIADAVRAAVPPARK
jgi:transketolase